MCVPGERIELPSAVCKTAALPLDEPGITRTTHSLPDTTAIVQGRASTVRGGDGSPLEMSLRLSAVRGLSDPSARIELAIHPYQGCVLPLAP